MKNLKLFAMLLCSAICFCACDSDEEESSSSSTTEVVTQSIEEEGVLVGKGITYTITSFTSNTAEVSGTTKEVDHTTFTGGFIIPEYIRYNGQKYKVTTIKEEAFINFYKMTEITLPSTLIEVGPYAFRNCYKVNQMVVKATTPPELGRCSIVDFSDTAILIVPTSSIDLYKNAELWRYFENVQGGAENK